MDFVRSAEREFCLKKSKKGKKYYGCEDNPNCNFMTWDLPTEGKMSAVRFYFIPKGRKERQADLPQGKLRI